VSELTLHFKINLTWGWSACVGRNTEAVCYLQQLYATD